MTDFAHSQADQIKSSATAGAEDIDKGLIQMTSWPSAAKPAWGSPAPLTLLGLCMSLTCISCDLMGWRGSGGGGAATTGTYYFMGGLLMVIAGVLEFFCGNTVPFVVSCGFGGFWLTVASTLTPSFGAWSAYSTDPVNDPYSGLNEPGFLASFAWFYVCMSLFSFISLLCSFKTNIPNIVCFVFLVIQYAILAASNWIAADGNTAAAGRLNVAAGATGFVVISSGWYLLASLLLEASASPIQLPVYDLSGLGAETF